MNPAAGHTYLHGGLCVDSELALPVAVASSDSVPARAPDVRITVDEAPGDDAGEVIVREQLCRFSIPGVGRYEIRDGVQVSVAPFPGAAPRMITPFVLGTSWGALLHQRGDLALHGGVVAVDGGAIAFCGPSTAGKSTTLAWCARRGHPIVSDDLCRAAVVSGGHAVVWPSGAVLKLSEAALRTGGWSGCDADPEPVDGKYHVPAGAYHGRAPLRLQAIYLLTWGADGVRRLRGLEALRRLQAEAMYRVELLTGAAVSRHWQLCVDLVRSVPVWELSRPRDWSALDRVMPTVTPEAADG